MKTKKFLKQKIKCVKFANKKFSKSKIKSLEFAFKKNF